MYVQKLRELAVAVLRGVVYVQKLRGLSWSGEIQSGLTAVITSNPSVIVPYVNREVKRKEWTKSGSCGVRGSGRG